MTQADPVRKRLLDAADSILFIDGPVSTRVEEILQRAAAAPASLYAHFGSKDGIVIAALRRRLQVWSETWSEAIDAAQTPNDKLLAVFTALTTYQRDRLTERWCAFSATTAALPYPSEELTKVLAAEDELLKSRLLACAQPIAGDRAAELAELVEVCYCGTLTLMLRGTAYEDAIARGHAAARLTLQAWLADSHA
ncbi:hypothetical protein BSZ39_04145 [Bowdeniella nasicola]|uniref:HTH tetR-type domain-containing protein n=1 Tax=Bowdeniella nasicola TaxID=208480 RepID=A0A1Q5Q3L5_9ACTO|nr:TetR/AcrR family transcriptional regulator [Bowdeniella nasicola]OKL54424.1 hypothetical protein BSZ39_04145 [Bowdeniella nasicola]